MLLLRKAWLNAGRWPSRSVSASTPSQSNRIASKVGGDASCACACREEVVVDDVDDDDTKKAAALASGLVIRLPLLATNADDDTRSVERLNRVRDGRCIFLYDI